MAPTTVTAVERNDDDGLVYNLNVGPHHNYFAAGVLVHNCIDDPNNPQDVESDVVRENTQIWLNEVMPDRLNDLSKDAIVCIQQRTHDMDATGTLLKQDARGWTHLMIPAEYDSARHCITVLEWRVPPDPETREGGIPARTWEDPRGLDDNGYRLPGRHANGFVDPGSPITARDGELYWPERIPKAQIQEMKTRKGPYAYSGQYMQIAVPRGGNIFKEEWWRYWPSKEYPDFISLIAWLDTAVKEGEENDYNAFVIFGLFADEAGMPNMILRHAWRMRTDLPSLCLRVGKDCQKYGVDYLLIEDKTRGHDCDFEIKRQFGTREWTTRLQPVDGDKSSRAAAVQHIWAGDAAEDLVTGKTYWKGGVVWAPDTDWAQEVIDEMKKFPKAEHDDYVDCCIGIAGWLRKTGVLYRPVEWDESELERRRFKKAPKAPYDV